MLFVAFEGYNSIRETVLGVYFSPKVDQYFNRKVYHFNLISKSVSSFVGGTAHKG